MNISEEAHLTCYAHHIPNFDWTKKKNCLKQCKQSLVEMPKEKYSM